MSNDLDQLLRELRELKEDVQRLKDVHEISQLKARYCRCIETKDWAGYADLLTENYELVSDGGVYTGRDDVVAFVSEALGNAVDVFHAHTEEINITGPDTATAIWARSSYLIMPGDGSPFVARSYGHYYEDYVRTRDGWRLKRTEEPTVHLDTEQASPAQVAALAKSSA